MCLPPWLAEPPAQVAVATQDEVAELDGVGAVGEICARFFDVGGDRV